jgi:hypothetical protein
MIHNERFVHALRVIAGASLLLAAGCAADATVDAKTTTESQSSAVQVVSSQTLRTDAIRSAAKSCSPLTCCFPAGGGWDDDAFEDALQGLGCSTPANYSEAAGTSAFWLYTRCPPSLKLAKLVYEYSNVAPYDARFIDSLCLELSAIGSGEPDSLFVEFDPTCETCIVNQE